MSTYYQMIIIKIRWYWQQGPVWYLRCPNLYSELKFKYLILSILQYLKVASELTYSDSSINRTNNQNEFRIEMIKGENKFTEKNWFRNSVQCVYNHNHMKNIFILYLLYWNICIYNTYLVSSDKCHATTNCKIILQLLPMLVVLIHKVIKQ